MTGTYLPVYNGIMSDAISSSQIVQEPQTVIDPRFFLPPGVIDVRSGTDEEVPNFYVVDEEFESVLDEDEIPPTGETAGDSGGETLVLAAPGYINIISQTIRFGPDGTQVVDVEIEIEDVEGATNYDVRVSKS